MNFEKTTKSSLNIYPKNSHINQKDHFNWVGTEYSFYFAGLILGSKKVQPPARQQPKEFVTS